MSSPYYELADLIRDELAKLGVQLMDYPDRTEWKYVAGRGTTPGTEISAEQVQESA
jgi:hypothetical protein